MVAHDTRDVEHPVVAQLLIYKTAPAPSFLQSPTFLLLLSTFEKLALTASDTLGPL